MGQGWGTLSFGDCRERKIGRFGYSAQNDNQGGYKFEPKATYDVVAANLYSDLLRQAVPRLVNATCDNGFLIFSGILRNQAPEVTAQLNQCDSELREVRTRGKWTTLLVQKKPGKSLVEIGD